MGSVIPGLYKKDPDARKKAVAEASGLTKDDLRALFDPALQDPVLEGMVENVIGSFHLPLGVATGFQVNGRDVLVPMVTEEPSVIAAASKGAQMARVRGGFTAWSTEQIMIGQVQLTDLKDPAKAAVAVNLKKDEVLSLADEKDPLLVKAGGGARELEVRILEHPAGTMLVVHLLVDCRDAMGANAVNTMAEAVAPLLEDITGGRAVLRILSNLATRRLSSAKAIFPKEELGGDEGVSSILKAFFLSQADPYRAATHNKGIMNGIDAVVLATGNDTRAVEAGAHAYASLSGRYSPLTSFHRDGKGDLIGEITVPTAVGVVGGATKVHPAAKASLKLMGVTTARELGEVLASVGLAQNIAALRALSLEGIQKGHMRLHARNLAIQAGARPDEVDVLVDAMVVDGDINASRASELLATSRSRATIKRI
ncbi:MAG: hydroxymethylglutaryl-CoA reductase, degradative [Candidatus Thermoplasmatota archaeon]|nr:hydroxymethylglutaryl-CoA reductase, degradative [Candidatus Thermoplasmatota archaeon]